MYTFKLKEILDYFDTRPYYLMIDESPDFKKRKIINLLIGELSSKEPTKPYIIDTIEFDVVNSAELHEYLRWWVMKIHTDYKLITNFKMIITDKAAYNLLLGKKLKITFGDKLLHVTCS